MSANLVKYLHLHKNFNWHHLLNSKENSFSCLSRAIAASSHTSSFPKATPRAQEPPTHSRSRPKHRLVRKNRQHTHEAFPKATPRAQEPSTHSRSIPQASPRAQEPPPHSRSIPQATPRAQEPPPHSRSIPQAPPRAQEPPPHSRSRPAHQPASDLLNQSKYYNFATI